MGRRNAISPPAQSPARYVQIPLLVTVDKKSGLLIPLKEASIATGSGLIWLQRDHETLVHGDDIDTFSLFET